jgi:hypothetical protein
MWRLLYHWLWPLFSTCHKAYGLSLPIGSSLDVAHGNGSLQMLAGQKLLLCPTPMMHLLVGLALLGLLCLLWSVGALFVRVGQILLGSSRLRRDPSLLRGNGIDEPLQAALAELERQAGTMLR